jgi:hypothetical protein
LNAASGLALLALAACWLPGSVQAHAPLARGLVLAREGGAMFVRLPGFGWVLRSGEQQPFAYACDALVGVLPGETVTPMVARADGALLVGTASGLRALDARGCPLPVIDGELGTAPISALAIAADGMISYAAAAGAGAALHRSDDGGASWVKRAALPSDQPVTGLQITGDDGEHVHVSVGSTDVSAAWLVSADGGASFARVEQARALTLLHVVGGTATESARLWAMGRAPSGQRGADIVHAEQPAGPWTAGLRVNFFGGFAREPSGVIWVGDEGGGVFRSDDGGEHFDEVAPEQAVACLTYGADALWACTPATPQKRAVARASDPATGFADVLALASVDRMVECGPRIDVNAICAAAWSEWQIDVRMTMGAAAPAAPVATTADASTTTTNDAGVLAERDVDERLRASDESGVGEGSSADGRGCNAVRRNLTVESHGAVLLWLVAALVLVTRRRSRSASA